MNKRIRNINILGIRNQKTRNRSIIILILGTMFLLSTDDRPRISYTN
jgi:hypothetical protein